MRIIVPRFSWIKLDPVVGIAQVLKLTRLIDPSVAQPVIADAVNP